MEVTSLFKQIVRNIENRPRLESDVKVPDKTRILKTSKLNKDQLEIKAVAIIKDIVCLQEFLSSNREAYIDVNLNRDHSISGLSDLERDKIDVGANNIIRTINQLIANFKSDIKEAKHLKAQQVQHLEAVTDILEAKLKSACRVFSEQKAIRVEKELQYQKLSRLEVTARGSKPEVTSKPFSDQERKPSTVGFNLNQSNEDISDSVELETSEQQSNRNLSSKQTTTFNDWSDEEDFGGELSPEEEQLLEHENDRMYEDLVSLQDTVQQIETKVVRIAELQEIFTEKVLQQKGNIDLIANNAIASTENVKDGNEELRKAIQRNASIRVYILFFLLVMSFSLLFLDWYNE